MEPKDKFAKPVFVTMREYVVRFLNGSERVLRLVPEDVLTQDADKEVLAVDHANGQQTLIYLRNALDVTFREYQKQVSPPPTR